MAEQDMEIRPIEQQNLNSQIRLGKCPTPGSRLYLICKLPPFAQELTLVTP